MGASYNIWMANKPAWSFNNAQKIIQKKIQDMKKEEGEETLRALRVHDYWFGSIVNLMQRKVKKRQLKSKQNVL